MLAQTNLVPYLTRVFSSKKLFTVKWCYVICILLFKIINNTANEWMKLFTFSILCGAAAYRVAVSCFRREQADLRKHVKRSFSFSQLGRQVINTRDIAPGTKFCRCLKSKDVGFFALILFYLFVNVLLTLCWYLV